MLLLNLDYVPDKKIQALGVVTGSVVQSKHFGRDFMAGMKTLVGGEIVGYTEMLAEAREIATKRMVDEAAAMGADGVIGLRYTTSAVMQGAAEVTAYGTAVRILGGFFLACALAGTLCQLEEVDSVYVTVEGDELPYRSMQHLSDGDILLDGGADEPMALDIELWYLTAGGQALGVERRQIVKTVEQTVAEAVLSAWAEGPRQEGLLPCLPQGSQIRSVELQDGVCAVDLSQEFIQGLPEDENAAVLMVYAMVNTLCQLEGVDAVQLYIDGSPAPAVGGLPLDRALIPDAALGAGG